jgi:hypothetical protein
MAIVHDAVVKEAVELPPAASAARSLPGSQRLTLLLIAPMMLSRGNA